MTTLRRFVAAASVLLALAGCDRSSPPGSSTVGSAASVASPARVASARPSASVAAPAVSSAPAVAPQAATRWAGVYDAKKAKLETPDKVKDVTWKKDDGTTAIGEGKLAISVRGTTVEGTASGPLGDQIVSGVYDGKELRISLMPKDPTLPGAMTGSGTGELKAGVLKGEFRCAGPDAVVVRNVTFELKPEG